MKENGKNVVIIGGGLGGLMAGAVLAKEGFAVDILEKNGIVGGGLQCFRRNGVLFETGMHILGGFLPGNNMDKICNYLGIADKLRIRHTDEDCIDSVTFGGEGGEGGDTYRLPRGRAAFGNYLCRLFPAQKDGILRYMDAMWKLSEEVDLFYLRAPQNDFVHGHSEDFLMPADEFIGKYITDPRLAELLAYMNPMYAGTAGHTPAYIHALINVLYINGSSMFINGSQQMADLLCGIIVSAGGSVHAGDAVNAVDVDLDNRLVQRVVTRSGKTYSGDWYISDIHPCLLLDLLPEKAFLKSYRDRLREIPNTYSSFSVYVKFKKGSRYPYVNHPCYYQESHGYVWKLDAYDESRFPLGFMYMTPPSENQGEYAEKMIVSCPMPFSAVSKWENTASGHRGAGYEQWKSRMIGNVLSKLEKASPGIRNEIESCFASSPLTIRDFYGTKEGSLYGYAKDCRNMPLSQLTIATKVRNLLLTGQNVNLHGICGVPLTAIETAEHIVGNGKIVEKINAAYDRRKKI